MTVFPSALGWMAICWQGEILQAVRFGHATPGDAVAACPGEPRSREDSHFRTLVRQLQAFAEGQRVDFADVQLAVERFTPFQRRVHDRCRQIEWGKTLTYAQLACEAGVPGAARAVGNVMAANPFPLLVPCHRVVGSSGGLGGYSGGAGVETKRMLLEREGWKLRQKNSQQLALSI